MTRENRPHAGRSLQRIRTADTPKPTGGHIGCVEAEVGLGTRRTRTLPWQVAETQLNAKRKTSNAEFRPHFTFFVFAFLVQAGLFQALIAESDVK